MSTVCVQVNQMVKTDCLSSLLSVRSDHCVMRLSVCLCAGESDGQDWLSVISTVCEKWLLCHETVCLSVCRWIRWSRLTVYHLCCLWEVTTVSCWWIPSTLRYHCSVCCCSWLCQWPVEMVWSSSFVPTRQLSAWSVCLSVCWIAWLKYSSSLIIKSLLWLAFNTHCCIFPIRCNVDSCVYRESWLTLCKCDNMV